MEFKIGDRVRIYNSPVPEDYHIGKVSTIVSTYKNSEGKTFYTLDNPNKILSCPNWSAEYLVKVPFEYKVGDTVRIVNPPGGDNAGIMSTIVDTYGNSFGDTIYTLDNEDGNLSCVNWGSKYLELVPFKVGDCVKYKTGNTAYEVTAISYDRIALKHLGNKKTYPEYNHNKLVKLQFKVGDRVEVLKGSCKGKIGTIKTIDCEGGIFYRLSNIDGVRFAEQNLKLATQDSKKEPKPTYYKGDIVYIDPDKVEDKEYCYKLWEVTSNDTDSISIECSTEGISCASLVKEYLKKPAFKVGEYFTIKHRNYEIKDVHFDNSKRLCYKLQDLYIIAFYTEHELLQIVERENDKLIKALDDSIINFNLNENDKDQLQREGTPEQSGCNEGGSRVYGRKPKSAIKVGHLGYQKVIGGGKSRIGRA